MPKINLKIAIPLILITSTTIGCAIYFSQEKTSDTSAQTYITNPKTSESSTLPSSQDDIPQPSQVEDVNTPSPQNEELVETFIKTYFTQVLTKEAIQNRLDKLTEVTTEDFQNEMNIETSSKVALAMVASYNESQLIPSGTTNVNAQDILKSQIFKSEQSEQEYFVQVEYSVTPLGSEDSYTIKNQVTLNIENDKISSMSVLNNQ